VLKLTIELSNEMYEIKQLNCYAKYKIMDQFIQSFVVGKLNNVSPLYTCHKEFQIYRLHKVIIYPTRTIVGNY